MGYDGEDKFMLSVKYSLISALAMATVTNNTAYMATDALFSAVLGGEGITFASGTPTPFGWSLHIAAFFLIVLVMMLLPNDPCRSKKLR